MTDVFLEREWATPLTAERLDAMCAEADGCFRLYRVAWQGSLLSADGKRLLCRFRGPDAESVRVAVRRADGDVRSLWPGTVHDAPGMTDDDLESARVLVQRSFDAPVELGEIQSIENGNIECLTRHRVKFVRTFFSIDRRRMACLYSAPDAESVRIAQRQAKMPVDSVWEFRRLAP